jgi:hypothetical protein
MSSALGIAAVSSVIRFLIENGLRSGGLPDELGDVKVTTLPPDKLSNADRDVSLINLFLYQVTPNTGWRNVDLPSRAPNGATISAPPLALDLHYLVSAHGSKELYGEVLLGCAMRLLHETPVLSRATIREILGGPESPEDPSSLNRELTRADLAGQSELIKVSLQTISSDEAFRLWTAMQGHYRATAAYQVSVVLIDSGLPVRPPLPVLRRGTQDRGAEVGAGTARPQIEKLRLPRSQSAAFLGDEIEIVGRHLHGATRLRFEHPSLPAPLELAVQGDAATRDGLKFTLSDTALTTTDLFGNTVPAKWIAGPFTLRAVTPGTERPLLSNAWRFCLAARIQRVEHEASGDSSTVTITFKPGGRVVRSGENALRLDQQVELLLPGQPTLTPDAETLPTFDDHSDLMPIEEISFMSKPLPSGTYLARLRIDGVEMPGVNWEAHPPVFDPAGELTV